MASTTFIKDTGFTGMLSLLLLGILLPSVLSVTTMPPNATDGMNGTAPSMSMVYCPSFMCNYTDCYMMYNSQNSVSCITWAFCQLMRQTDMSYVAGCVGSCAESCVNASQTNCSVDCCNSTGCLNATFASMMTMTTSTVAPSAPSTLGPTDATQISTTMTTSMNYTTSTDMNGTAPSMSMVYCPSFMCNYTDCYMMYNSENTTSCALGCCQLMRQMDMSYVASCVASCAESCVNASQTNCSVNCCNSTGCLNATFASMMTMTTSTDMAGTTTTTVATTTRPATTTMASSRPPTVDNGKKCHQGTCTGSTCYTDFAALQTCSSAQPHCQLKKETVSSNTMWTAGCTANCSAEIPCKQSTTPPCHLECCNATMTSSCLWRNGTLNVPNFATRGPHLNTELGASLLCLLAIALLL